MTILDSSHRTTPASRKEMCQMDKEGRGRASLATQSLPSHAPTQGWRETARQETARGDPLSRSNLGPGPTLLSPPDT